jgi:hypothetical protein
LSLSPTAGAPGDVLTLTITKKAGDARSGVEPFALLAGAYGVTTFFWAVTSD